MPYDNNFCLCITQLLHTMTTTTQQLYDQQQRQQRQLSSNIQSQTLLVQRLEAELEIEKQHLARQISKLYASNNVDSQNQQQATPPPTAIIRLYRPNSSNLPTTIGKKRSHDETQTTTLFVSTHVPHCWPNDPRLTKAYQSKIYNGIALLPEHAPTTSAHLQQYYQTDDDKPLENGEIQINQ